MSLSRLKKNLAAAEHVIRGMVSLIHRDHEIVDTRAESVSAWSVGQQMEHTGKVAMSIATGAIPSAAASVPARDKRTIISRLSLWWGWIPRGGGKTPSHLAPKSSSYRAVEMSLRGALEALAYLKPGLDDLGASQGRTPHATFGPLTAAQWLRFIAVHSHHHQKIIRDILKAAARSAA